jgi:sugar phosphate permease
MQANSVTWILMLGSGVAAPIVAGFLLRSFGLNVIVYTSIAFFLLSMLLNSFIKMPFTKPEKCKVGLLKLIVNDTKEGFNYIFHENKTLNKATVGLILMALILGPVLFFIPPVFITNILELDETRVGLAQGIIAVGGIAGVLLLGVLGEKINVGKFRILLVISALILIATAGLFSLTSNVLHAYLILVIGLFLINGLMAMGSMVYFTYLGQNTPEDIVGKIMAFAMTVMFTAYTIVSFLSGHLFDLFSSQPAISMMILPIAALILSPLVKINTETNIVTEEEYSPLKPQEI